jgi:hypothetical protein
VGPDDPGAEGRDAGGAVDQPVERPAKLELVLSLATARALGLAVPAEARLRADRVIE